MRAHFRCFWLGITFLAVIAAATSCKKPKEPAPEKAAEPWVVAAALEWTEAPMSPTVRGPTFLLYSDRRLIIRRLSVQRTLAEKPTFWVRTLSEEEFERVDQAAVRFMKCSEFGGRLEFGTYMENGACTWLYFGLQEKGAIVDLDEVHLFSLVSDEPQHFPKLLDANHLPVELREYWKALLM